MIYKFTVIKSEKTDTEEFESALNCSVQSIKRLLHGYHIL